MAASSSVRDELQLLEENNIVVWPAILYAGIILPFSVCGNIVVILVFFINFKPSATRSFVLAIGFFSLCLAAITLPVELYSLFHMFTFPSALFCQCYVFMAIFCAFGSVSILLVVAIHRYKKICQPFKQQMTLTMARGLRACVFVLALGLASPAFILYGIKTVDIPNKSFKGQACGVKDDFKNTIYVVIYYYMLLTVFIGGGITIAVLYTLVGKKVLLLLRCKCTRAVSYTSYNSVMRELIQTIKRKSESESTELWIPTRFSRRSNNSSRRRRSIAQSKRTTSMLAVTTLVIFVSFLPSLMLRTTDYYLLDQTNNMSVTGQMVYHVFLKSYYIHCAASPIIYGAFNAKFRHELRALLLCDRVGSEP